MDYAGPLWLGSIFDPDFIELIMKENMTHAFKNSAKIAKLLALTKNEATEPLTYYVLDKLCGKLGLPSPSIDAFANSLRSNGYQVSKTHFNSRGIRTNAPALTLHKLLKETSRSSVSACL
jgi:tRNA (guanine26-N2/guanine27-N2)-dimethyltransferase